MKEQGLEQGEGKTFPVFLCVLCGEKNRLTCLPVPAFAGMTQADGSQKYPQSFRKDLSHDRAHQNACRDPHRALCREWSAERFHLSLSDFSEADLAVYLDGAKQASGYTITGEGETEGGSVIFDAAPALGVVVTLSRELPIARVSDFLEGRRFFSLAP